MCLSKNVMKCTKMEPSHFFKILHRPYPHSLTSEIENMGNYKIFEKKTKKIGGQASEKSTPKDGDTPLILYPLNTPQ